MRNHSWKKVLQTEEGWRMNESARRKKYSQIVCCTFLNTFQQFHTFALRFLNELWFQRVWNGWIKSETRLFSCANRTKHSRMVIFSQMNIHRNMLWNPVAQMRYCCLCEAVFTAPHTIESALIQISTCISHLIRFCCMEYSTISFPHSFVLIFGFGCKSEKCMRNISALVDKSQPTQFWSRIVTATNGNNSSLFKLFHWWSTLLTCLINFIEIHTLNICSLCINERKRYIRANNAKWIGWK